MQHAERPAHAEEHHDYHGADAGHEAAMAAGAVKHGDQRLPPPGQSLPGARRTPIRHGAAAYRVQPANRRGAVRSHLGAVCPGAWPTRERLPRHRPSTGEPPQNSEEKNGMASLVVDCRKTVRAAFCSALGVRLSVRFRRAPPLKFRLWSSCCPPNGRSKIRCKKRYLSARHGSRNWRAVAFPRQSREQLVRARWRRGCQTRLFPRGDRQSEQRTEGKANISGLHIFSLI